MDKANSENTESHSPKLVKHVMSTKKIYDMDG